MAGNEGKDAGNTAEKQEQQTAQQSEAAEFAIQKIYVKDLSFEAPNSPAMFQGEWKPDVNLELNTTTNQVEDSLHEVILGVTVTVKVGDKVAFLVEVQQAGIFTIDGLQDEQLRQALGSFCPNILFPYVREVVSDVVIRGGYPQLNLAPINFDAVYAQYQEQQKSDDAAAGGEVTTN